MDPSLPPNAEQVCRGGQTPGHTDPSAGALAKARKTFMDTCFWPHLCLTRPAPKGLIFNLFLRTFGVYFWKCSLDGWHIPLGMLTQAVGADGMGCELGERLTPQPSLPRLSWGRALLLCPRSLLFPFPKPMARSLPHSHCLFVSIPFSLAKTERWRN